MNYKSILSIASLAFLMSCGDSTTETPETPDSTAVETENEVAYEEGVLKGTKFTLRALKDSPTFPETKLSITAPETGTVLEKGTVDFQFTVEGGDYTLGSQTEDAETKSCANSGKGQHIHLIVDNTPYEASYKTEHTTKAEFEEGNHVALAFISRSYHESLKHEGAFAITQFQVGEEKIQDPIDLEAPHLFYSRPKGSYNISEAGKIFLDFYLVNTTIADGGNYVLATIDGEPFKVTSWEPFVIEGLEVGEHTVKIELYDKEGNFIEGPFNAEERTFTVAN